jgi:hypothetical protein
MDARFFRSGGSPMTAASEMLVTALVETGWRLWATSHNNTSSALIIHRWMRDIATGQLVLEITSTRRPAIDRIGVLLAITSKHEYTIRTIDGRELRWENSDFVRIPRNAVDNHEIFLRGYDLPGGAKDSNG